MVIKISAYLHMTGNAEKCDIGKTGLSIYYCTFKKLGDFDKI